MDTFRKDHKKVSIFFFPFIAAGHLLPMIGVARAFARHPSVRVTIIATPKNVDIFREAIDRDRENGHDIGFLTIELPNQAELGGVENFLAPVPLSLKLKVFMAVMNLKETLKGILCECRPDCLVSDPMHPWSLGVAEEVGIPRIVFHSSSLFGLCCEHVLWRFKPQEGLSSDNEPFVLDGLPDRVEFTRKVLPHWHRQQNSSTAFFHEKLKADFNSYGVITNSFQDLERDYFDYSKIVIGSKVWMVGPVSNKHTTSNGHDSSPAHVLKWLDSKEPRSVLYVSFGTEAFLVKDQFHEIARGLKASGHPFIWVARTETSAGESDEAWFPKGFEEEMRESNQGLVLKGWAPQVVILGHPNVAAFMTHCGWNSCLEGLTNCVPMVTWPITADQFFNESLLVDVAKVAIRVGNKEEMMMDAEAKATVASDQVEEATRRIIEDEDVVKKIRTRVKKYGEEAKKAVQQGGSSNEDIDKLVQELIIKESTKDHPKSSSPTNKETMPKQHT